MPETFLELLTPIVESAVLEQDHINYHKDWIEWIEKYYCTHIVKKILRLKAKLSKIFAECLSRRNAKHFVESIVHVIKLKCSNL